MSDMRYFSLKRLFLLLALINAGQIARGGDSSHLSEKERAVAFVVQEEATDYALEARSDVCVGFGAGIQLNERAVFAALKDKGLRFHPLDWCNRGPRGITILITVPIKQTLPGSYEIRSDIGDSDPIRLYGDHFATLLRKSAYTVMCENGSQPILKSYQLICCEKDKSSKPVRSPNQQ